LVVVGLKICTNDDSDTESDALVVVGLKNSNDDTNVGLNFDQTLNKIHQFYLTHFCLYFVTEQVTPYIFSLF